MLKKSIIIIISVFVCFFIVSVVYDNKEKEDDKKMWEEHFSTYKNLWSNGSIHKCNLKDVDGFVITDTNMNEFKDSRIIVSIKDNFLYIKSLTTKKEIQTRLVKGIETNYTHNEYRVGNDEIQPYITSILDVRKWNDEKSYFNVYKYYCEKK